MTRKLQNRLATQVRGALRTSGARPSRIVAGGYALRNKEPQLIHGFVVSVPQDSSYEYVVVRHRGRYSLLPWSLETPEHKGKERERVGRVLGGYADTLRAVGFEVTVVDGGEDSLPYLQVSDFS